jgi:hypothetical protein
MAITLAAAGAAIVANKASFASVGLGSAEEAQAVGDFLIVAGRNPGLADVILRLVNDKNLTENRP